MARILILTLGSRGDVQPYLALARALASRGHDVTVSTGRGFADLVPDQVSYRPLSVDMEAVLQEPEMQAAMVSVRAKFKAFRTSRAMMQQQLDEVWGITKDTQPDAIIYHPKAFIAPYLARALGIIAVASFLQPAFRPTEEFPNPLLNVREFGPRSNRLFGTSMIRLMRLGHRSLLKDWLPRHPDVPTTAGIDVLAGYHPRGLPLPRLYAHSTCLVPKPCDWGDEDHVTGQWHDPDLQIASRSSELMAFLDAGPPPFYVGFGSMPSLDGARLTDTILIALARTGQRAVLSTGWGGLVARDNTDMHHFLQSAPHDWLFPRCSAVVHHGGAGTTHGGLRHGRPTLVCPYFGDQPFWGRRVAAIGAGPDPIPVKSLTAGPLTAALMRLKDGGFSKSAQAAAQCMACETGTTTAARLVERALDA